MTGVLAEVGRGKLSPAEVASFFRIKTDIPARLTAPPSGLFLEKVYYKNDEVVYTTKPLINI
jgi:tRNA pseudouridine38-40 synthase